MINHPQKKKIRDESTKHYPGFRGGAKRPTTEFRYIKVPGGRRHIKDEPGLSTFVKKRYNITFTWQGKKKKQAVWARDETEAIAMLKDLYPGAGAPFKKNPRGAGIPIDHIQLNLMIEAHKSGKVFADSTKERKEMDRLVYADLMSVISKANDVYELTARGKKLLVEYLKEREKET